MQKIRIDVLLTEKGLSESRAQAQRLVMAGQVKVNGQVELKASTKVSPDADVQVEMGPRFVSRGGEKLDAALQNFEIDVREKICADVGASTGGFTDCLLQYGAKRVYSIDVGYGILHWKLRNHPKVVSMERVNARYLETLPEPVSLITIDASFISLKLLLPVVTRWLDSGTGDIVTLIKPQFEAGKAEVDRGEGVIQDPNVHRQVLQDVLGFAQQNGFRIQGLIQSPLRGPKGNIEFLAHFKVPGETIEPVDKWVDQVLHAPGVKA